MNAGRVLHTSAYIVCNSSYTYCTWGVASRGDDCVSSVLVCHTHVPLTAVSYRGDLTNTSTAFDSGTPLELTPDGYPKSLPDGITAHKLVLRNVQLHAMAGR